MKNNFEKNNFDLVSADLIQNVIVKLKSTCKLSFYQIIIEMKILEYIFNSNSLNFHIELANHS